MQPIQAALFNAPSSSFSPDPYHLVGRSYRLFHNRNHQDSHHHLFFNQHDALFLLIKTIHHTSLYIYDDGCQKQFVPIHTPESPLFQCLEITQEGYVNIK